MRALLFQQRGDVAQKVKRLSIWRWVSVVSNILLCGQIRKLRNDSGVLRVIRDVMPFRHLVYGGRVRDFMTFRKSLSRCRCLFGRIATECWGCDQNCE
jgi:hypothetical protein